MNKHTILTLENINKHYKTSNEDLHILRDLNFSLLKGEFVSIVGKSGSGKSTFLNIIGLLDTPTTGDIYYNNSKIIDFSEKERTFLRSKHIGFIFQFHYLLPEFTALENVIIPALFGKVNRKKLYKRGQELLEIVGLSDRLDHKPAKLSGGEKQRVAIARSLINEPDLILADEPTGNLDDETSESIHNLFKDLNRKNHSIIVVTHSNELAKITEKKYSLHNGKLS